LVSQPMTHETESLECPGLSLVLFSPALPYRSTVVITGPDDDCIDEPRHEKDEIAIFKEIS